MMKTPTTKKLPKKTQYTTDGYMPIAENEAFYQCPKYPDIFISQYAQVIQVFKNKKAIVRKTFYITDSGYTTITLTNSWGKRKNWGIHHLVGMVWLEKMSFLPEDEPQDVHHIYKVLGMKASSIDVNFACNLMYVYRKYHKILDTTRSLKVSVYGGGWKSMKSIEEVSKHLNKPLKDIYELLLGKYTYMAEGLEYYEIDKFTTIEVRKYKSKGKKKPKKKK